MGRGTYLGGSTIIKVDHDKALETRTRAYQKWRNKSQEEFDAERIGKSRITRQQQPLSLRERERRQSEHLVKASGTVEEARFVLKKTKPLTSKAKEAKKEKNRRKKERKKNLNRTRSYRTLG